MTGPINANALLKDKQYKILIIVIVVLVVGIVIFLAMKAAGAGGSLLDGLKKLFAGLGGGIDKVFQSVGIGEDSTNKEADAAQSDPNSAFNPNYLNNVPTSVIFSIGGQANYDDIAKQIYDYPGIFSDDFSEVMSAFKQLSTKAQIAQLAQTFLANYNADLLQFLRDGGGILPWDGLSSSHLQQILDYVKALPNY